MPQFDFRLNKLLALRQYRRELCRAELAEACAREQSLANRQLDLEAELAAQHEAMRVHAAPGSIAVDVLRGAAHYEGTLRARLAAVAEEQRRAAEAFERCQQSLAAAEQAVGVLEKLRARHVAQFARQQARLEVRQLDEAAAYGHRNCAARPRRP